MFVGQISMHLPKLKQQVLCVFSLPFALCPGTSFMLCDGQTTLSLCRTSSVCINQAKPRLLIKCAALYGSQLNVKADYTGSGGSLVPACCLWPWWHITAGGPWTQAYPVHDSRYTCKCSALDEKHWKGGLHGQGRDGSTSLLFMAVEAHFRRRSLVSSSSFPAMLTARALTLATASCPACLKARMMTCGCTPSSTKGLHSFRNSPARMTTVVVPSPTCAQARMNLRSVCVRFASAMDQCCT